MINASNGNFFCTRRGTLKIQIYILTLLQIKAIKVAKVLNNVLLLYYK